eukprot:5077428-Prymnesium_polylepis.1
MTRHFTCQPHALCADLPSNWYTPVLATLSHATPIHACFNMLSLYGVGYPLAIRLGPRRFMTLFWTSALISTCATVSHAYLMQLRSDAGTRHIYARSHGASGGICGLLVVTIFLQPTVRFLLLGLVPLPGWLLVLGTLGYDAAC